MGTMPTSRVPDDRDGDQSTDSQHTAHTDTDADTAAGAGSRSGADQGPQGEREAATAETDAATDDAGTATDDPGDGLREYCPRCGAATPHAVRIEVQASSDAKYSRQPHRISRCRECDRTVEARVGY